MKALTQRERRLTALGLLIGAFALVWLIVVGPLVGGFFDRAAERAELRATYQRNQRLMTSLPAWRALAETQRLREGRFAISAQSEPLAVESLKARLQRLAADEGYAIANLQDLQADAPAGEVKVRADMAVTLTQLSETMRRLESEGAYVVVDYLSISADRALASGRAAPMDIRLEISADWRPVAARPS